MKIGLDELVIDLALRLVGVSTWIQSARLLPHRRHHDHAIGSRLLRAWPARVEPDDDFVSAVAKILRLRVSLAAVAQDGDRLALQCSAWRRVHRKF